MSKLNKRIKFKKPDKGAYDAGVNGLKNMLLIDELGHMPAGLPKDYVNFKKIGILDKDGNVKPLRFTKPKQNKKASD